MADRTNLELAVDAMLEDLRRISPANGFCSDVKTKAALVNHPPDSEMVMSLDAPSIQVWVLETSESEYTSIGSPKFDAVVWIAGTVKNDRETQKKLWRLSEDIHNVMFWNPQRKFPGSTVSPSWCFTSKPETTQFFVEQAQSSYGSGQLLSKWRVTFNAPNPQL